jgi:F0F1-type ATP synthase membrane subunit b/b'
MANAAEAENPVNAIGTLVKNAVAAMRDLVIFLLFLLLLLSPATIKERLERAGFQKANIAGFEWQAEGLKTAAEQTKSAGQQVEQASKEYEALLGRLKDLETKVTSPEAKAAVREIGVTAAASQAQLETADKVLKRSLATQQDIVSQVSPGSVAEAGWVYLGKVSEDKTQWVEGSPKTVQPVPPQSLRGAKLSVRDDVYIRADSGQSARSSAAIVGVAKAGETLQVSDVEFSHAKGGGWFVWTKVKRA